jgi:prevent-host-death family protein
MNWQLAEAKNRFSEVVNKALTEGPQRVQRRGQAVVVVAEADYQRLTGKRPSFKKYLSSGPSLQELDLTRDSAPGRSIVL